MTTNVPAPTFGAAGFIAPAESDILAGAMADMQAAFGGDLNPSLDTPQGQLATSLAAVVGDCNNQFLALANGIDPAYAAGRMQDAIGRIYFIERNPAQPTAVMVQCSGASGTVIPAGSLVADASGNLYASSGAATIVAGGTVTTQFECTATGPIACPAGAISGSPYKALNGWDSATNLVDGVIGNVVESRADFEFRRRASVALNAHGSVPAIKAAVLSVSGVLDAYVIDNPTGASVNVGSTSKAIAAHAVYVAVVGGADADIANAIWTKKDLGCDMVGSTTVTVTDSVNYSYPYPSYTIKFQRPSNLAIKFAVSIVNSASLPADITTQIKAAIASAFVGGDGQPRARIGATIFASRFYSAVAAVGPFVQILSVLVGTSSPTLTSVSVGIDQAPTVALSDITVTLV